MPEHSSDTPPSHPFVAGVHVGAPEPDRHNPIDQGGDVDVSAAERDELERRAASMSRRTGRSRTPARAAKRTGRTTAKSSRSRRSSEVTLGALAVVIVAGYGAYWLVAAVLGLEPSLALLAGGYAAGICSGGVVWPLWRAARRAVGSWITPGAGR